MTKHWYPWMAAIMIFCAIEGTIYGLYKPNAIERSDLIVQPIQRFYDLLAERWVIWEKLRRLEVPDPIAVHVGDSSGYFGIMPEVVSQYIGGKEILNLSCCANQGFHGYLAELEYALRTYPTIKFAIIYMSPVVHPSPVQWRGSKALDFGGGATMAVLGDTLEDNLTSVRHFFFPPSNALRPAIVRDVLSARLRAGLHLVTPPTKSTPVYDRANVILERKGYMIEHDIQTEPRACNTPVYYDDRTGRSYFDLMMEEFAALGKRFDVTPVLIFQPWACPYGSGNATLVAEVERLREKYPAVRIPFPLVETWPANFFAVPAHVQRTMAIETSRRMGRVMRDLLASKDRYPFGSDITRAGSNATIRIVSASKGEVCGYDPEFREGFYADLTGLFAQHCDGRSSCGYRKGTDARDTASPKGCKVVYMVSYQCTNSPVRLVRQEGIDSFDGQFGIDCRAEAGLSEDPMPYGIQVAHATFASMNGGDPSNVTVPVQAWCDGRFECDFPVHAARLGVAQGTYRFAVRYHCGRELQARSATLTAAAGNGEIVRLQCNNGSQTFTR